MELNFYIYSSKQKAYLESNTVLIAMIKPQTKTTTNYQGEPSLAEGDLDFIVLNLDTLLPPLGVVSPGLAPR